MRYADMLTRKDSRSVVHFNFYEHVPLILQNTPPPSPYKKNKNRHADKKIVDASRIWDKNHKKEVQRTIILGLVFGGVVFFALLYNLVCFYVCFHIFFCCMSGKKSRGIIYSVSSFFEALSFLPSCTT